MNKTRLNKLILIASDLADTGKYPDWREVVEDVPYDEFPNAVRDLSKDPAVMEALDLRCQEAWDRKWAARMRRLQES